MLYLIYKITNKINGKYYIGCHKTKNINDGYMGSGKLISQAIGKYGLDNFTKEIIHTCSSEKEMFLIESQLVIVDRNTTYNLLPGGKGGWSYINESGIGGHNRPHTEETKIKIGKAHLGKKLSEEHKQKIAESNKLTNESRGIKVKEKLTGKPKTEEHKQKIRESILRKNRLKNASVA